MNAYSPEHIEPKWQKYWSDRDLYRADAKSNAHTQYVLEMFPYPSAAGLHVGHVEGYTAGDIYSRFLRMNGYNVLHPMGWDAFGLPAENYAIKSGIHPRETTNDAIQTFRKQINRLGLSYDWEREVSTHTPEYYRWTQWLFLQLFKNDLAYRAEAPVNWCPSCQTVLANEQVEDGACERCKSEVIQKEMEQWFFNITSYADQLVDDLDSVDWPESTKVNQRNWIGRSEGAEIRFPVADSENSIDVFTTRPDTLFGATYMVLSPEHELVDSLREKVENWTEVAAYRREAGEKSEDERTAAYKEKTGIQLKGIFAENPATGEKIPVFIADYVLAHYGTGAIMAVPAHDERDYAFAEKYDLPIRYVVAPHRVDTVNPPQKGKHTPAPRRTVHGLVRDPDTGKFLALEWKKHPWTTFIVGGVEEGESLESAARREIEEETGYTELKFRGVLACPVQGEYFAAHKDENRVAHAHVVLFDLEGSTRKEVASEEANAHEPTWVDIQHLPQNFVCAELDVWLDYLSEEQGQFFEGEGVLIHSGKFNGIQSSEAREAITEYVGGTMRKQYTLRDWLVSRQRYWGTPIPVVYDPDGNPHPVPEEHLPWELPDDVEFKPTGTAPLAESKELAERTERIFGKGWKPEVDTLDTFVDSSWYYFRYADPKNADAFAGKDAMTHWLPVDCYIGGAEHTVLHLMYARFFTKVLRGLGHASFHEPFYSLRHQGTILGEDGHKMSKSRGNVVNPDDIIVEYGADTLRLYEMFLGPLEDSKPWDSDNLVGVRRFLERIWRIREKVSESTEADESLQQTLHKTIDKVNKDIPAFKFNTAISQLMICANTFEKQESIPKHTYETFLVLVAPFAPHIAEELWGELGNEPSVHEQDWPMADPALLTVGSVNVAVQFNGVVRGEISLSPNASEEEAREAIPETLWGKWTKDAQVERVIYVPGKIINVVIKDS